MSLMAPSPADAARRAGLRRMRLLAVSLLVLAAVVYALTLNLDHSGVWGYVNTGAEAAMVGALADWFAVTALFRHPLGLPVPHTAIIPKRKNEIGRNLQEFVTENFLTEEIARDRLAAAHVGERVGLWLGVPQHRQRVRTEVVRVARAGLGRMSDDEVRALVEDFLVPRLVQEPVAPIAGTLLEGIVDEQTHHGLVDLGLEQLRAYLADNPGTYAAVLGERAPWWSPPWVDDKVIGWTYQQVLAWLQDIHDDPRHPARQALDELLRRLASDLQTDPQVMASAEALKERLLTHPQVPETAVGLWTSFKTSLTTAMDDETLLLPHPRRRAARAPRPAPGRGRGVARAARGAPRRGGVVLRQHLRQRARRGHLGDGRPLGRPGGRRPDRAARRPRPAVHPDQRHHRRCARRPRHPRPVPGRRLTPTSGD